MAYNIIIAAKSNQGHNHILTQVLEGAKNRKIVFNVHKLQLRVNEVKYLVTIVILKGAKPDISNMRAIVEMTSTADKAIIRCWLGMIYFLAAHPQYVSSTSVSVEI